MIDFMKKLARGAGEICLKHAEAITLNDLDFKGKRDLVTVVDTAVEKFIVETILSAFPDHDIIGEESGTTTKGSSKRWIIDPIDGTVSYFHRQPYYSVSIAFQNNEITEAGVVYGPALNQMFTAVRGKGAFLNDTKRLSVSQTEMMIDSVLATGFACLRAGREPNNLFYLQKILPKIRDFRRCGSAALDLAYVAAGKVDGFWEMELNIYDIAAGALLVEEAGGKISDMSGEDNYPVDGMVASNLPLYEELLSYLKLTP